MRTIGLNHLKAPRHDRNAAGGFTILELMIVLAILAALAAAVVPMVGSNVEDAKETAAKVSVQAVRDAYMDRFVRDMKYTEWFQNNFDNVYVHDLMANSRINQSSSASGSYDVAARKGWNGPYLDPSRSAPFPARNGMNPLFATNYQARNFYSSSGAALYGDEGASIPYIAANDPWGNPIVLQIPVAGAFNFSKIYPAAPTAEQIKETRLRFGRVLSAGPNGVIETTFNNAIASNRGDDIVIFLNRSDVNEDVAP